MYQLVFFAEKKRFESSCSINKIHYFIVQIDGVLGLVCSLMLSK